MERKAFLVAGMAFGDEGKGATVDYLVRKHNAKLVVRYNGGPQAAHNVISPEGIHHTFSQFGSGSLVAGVQTHLSRYMLIDPLLMLSENNEISHLSIAEPFLPRVTIEEKALVITPFQRALGRLVEIARGDKRHGSCGIGVGQTRKDHLQYGDKVLFAGDLRDASVTRDKLNFLQQLSLTAARSLEGKLKMDSVAVDHEFALLRNGEAVKWFTDRYVVAWLPRVKIVNEFWLSEELEKPGAVIFEGAQGVMLDEYYGTAPYNTWTDTTFNNARKLLGGTRYRGEVTSIGCLRPYYTHHGPGPFPTEMIWGISVQEIHNGAGQSQGKMRFGHFDTNLAKKAITICGEVDQLAISCMDHLPLVYDLKHSSPERLLDRMESELDVPISIVGYGPRSIDRQERFPFDQPRAKHAGTYERTPQAFCRPGLLRRAEASRYQGNQAGDIP